MRLTDFWERMDAVLGVDYARSWAKDFILPGFGCCVEEAITAGEDTKEIWREVCTVIDVPSPLI